MRLWRWARCDVRGRALLRIYQTATMLDATPLVFSSLFWALVVIAIVFAGAVVQAGLGMGFGLSVAPLLALIDPMMVPTAALFLGFSTALAGAWSERQHIVWREVGVGFAGRFTGILVGGWVLLSLTDVKLFSLVFGCTILFAVVLTTAGWELALNRFNLLMTGLVSGFTGIITSVGAPPLALIYQNRPAIPSRPTLATFFALGGSFSLLFIFITGRGGWVDVQMALFMVPSAVTGTWFGRRLRGRFDTRYRPALLLIAFGASVLLILRGLL